MSEHPFAFSLTQAQHSKLFKFAKLSRFNTGFLLLILERIHLLSNFKLRTLLEFLRWLFLQHFNFNNIHARKVIHTN